MSSSLVATVPSRRRTRFVCIADTHNRPVKLPKGDVLIHAGDLTNQGSYSEVGNSMLAYFWSILSQRVVCWLESHFLGMAMTVKKGPRSTFESVLGIY